MPPWLSGLLMLAVLAGLVLAFFVGRKKGLARFSKSIQQARAEGAADLRAQLGQHVQVNVGNVSHGRSSQHGESTPATLGELSHEPTRLADVQEFRAIAEAAHARQRSTDDYPEPFDDDAAYGLDDDDIDYAAALSRAMEHDDNARGYDPAVYPPSPGRGGSVDHGGSGRGGSVDHRVVARGVRTRHHSSARVEDLDQ